MTIGTRDAGQGTLRLIETVLLAVVAVLLVLLFDPVHQHLVALARWVPEAFGLE